MIRGPEFRINEVREQQRERSNMKRLPDAKATTLLFTAEDRRNLKYVRHYCGSRALQSIRHSVRETRRRIEATRAVVEETTAR